MNHLLEGEPEILPLECWQIFRIVSAGLVMSVSPATASRKPRRRLRR